MTSVKTEQLRGYHGHVTNTAVWETFALRPDDVIVSTPPKCGTTWMLNIVMMLIHGKVVPDAGNREDAPWLDAAFRQQGPIAAFLDGLERRRCIKTHTPLDGISYGAEPAYIVVYRHPVNYCMVWRSLKDASPARLGITDPDGRLFKAVSLIRLPSPMTATTICTFAGQART